MTQHGEHIDHDHQHDHQHTPAGSDAVRAEHGKHSGHSSREYENPHPGVDDHAVHIRELLAEALRPRVETVPLGDALGRVTSAAIMSPVDLPLFRNSQMDGYAVMVSDLTSLPSTLPVVGEIAARAGLPAPLVRGSTVHIMTGAPVPEGADAIVPVEAAVRVGHTITISRSPASGEFIRDRGSDARAGEQLLPAGVHLAPRHLAVLAAAGMAAVEVVARVRVAVITTGAELVSPGEIALAGQVYDANSIALQAAVREAGAVVSLAAQVSDDSLTLLDALRRAATVSEFIITSGGISMGEHEVVRETLEPLGARVGHIAMQPGGPQATAVFEGVPVVSFPGNPVSTQVSFAVFLSPLLRQAAGLPPKLRARLTLDSAVTSAPGKRQFLRGRTTGGGVTVVAGTGSHLVAQLAASDVLIVIPEKTTTIRAGDTVETWEL